MSPLSWTVLLPAGAIASPALWAAIVDGTMPLDVALTRVLITLVGTWAAMSVLAPMVYPAPPVPARTEPTDETPD